MEDVPRKVDLDVEFNGGGTIARDIPFGVVKIVSHFCDRTISPRNFITRQDIIGPFQL